MALGVCIPDLIAKGKLTGDRAKRAGALYDELLAAERGKWGEDAAASMATQKVLAVLEKDFANKKRVTLLTVTAQGRWLADMRRAAGDGAFDPVYARREIEKLDKRVDAVRNGFLAGFDKLLERHRRNLLGEVRNRDDLTVVLQERFKPGSTGDVNAREIAEAMGQTMDALRARRNAAGGATAKLDDFVFPQRHDSRLVRKLGGYQAWRALPQVDRAKVRDIETGEWATGIRRETILRGAWEGITTDGANSSKPGATFASSLANQRSDPRVIHFADVDDWMAYQQQFSGVDNIYDLFIGHVSGMAREIVLMENMGPNPNAMLRFQQDWVKKSILQKGSQKQIDGTLTSKGIEGHQKALQDTYDELTGANKMPGSRGLALAFSGVRAVQVSAKLGSAVLSAVPDMATMLLTARYNRVPQMKALGRYLKMWAGGAEDRALAVRLGLVTEDWINLSSASYRYTGEELTGEVTRRMADFVLRAQGLSRHTRNAQWAFGMEFAGHLTTMRDRDFGALDPGLQRQMARYGLSSGDWDKYRATAAVQERGSDWILPTSVKDRVVGERVLEMILAETDYAIIMPDIRTRTQLNSQLRSGTWIGDIGRSALLFKSFPLAIINLHGARMMEQPGGWSKAGYGVSLIAAMTAGGALAAQLKLLAAGKDPQPMDDRKFMAKAVIQSGGLGIFGDLLYNGTNSFGGGLIGTLAGPLLGQTIPGLAKLTTVNATRALDGDDETDTQFGRDAVNLLRSEVPGNNLWYVRQAYQRLLMDRVQAMVDDDADDYFAGQLSRAEDEGTAFFLPPGSTPTEARMPNFANALGDGE